MSNDVEYLMEMGWTKEYAEKALEETKNQGLQVALEWIMEHPPTEAAENIEGDLNKPLVEAKQPEAVPQSYKCEDCDKLLRTPDEIQMHSARTGHANFKESTDEVKPLTEEEKVAQKLKLEEHMRVKKVQRDEEERQKQLDDEKRRRRQGKYIVSAKAKFQEDEMKRNAEQLKRERAEDRAYREKLRTEIARDKEEKLAKQRAGKAGGSSAVTPTIPAAQLISPKPTAGLTPTTECRVQIRTPVGRPLVCSFKPQETLAAVVLYASQNWPDSPTTIDTREITLQTSFPTKRFSEEDFEKTLESLGLCPSVVLMAQRRPIQ